MKIRLVEPMEIGKASHGRLVPEIDVDGNILNLRQIMCPDDGISQAEAFNCAVGALGLAALSVERAMQLLKRLPNR